MLLIAATESIKHYYHRLMKAIKCKAALSGGCFQMGLMKGEKGTEKRRKWRLFKAIINHSSWEPDSQATTCCSLNYLKYHKVQKAQEL